MLETRRAAAGGSGASAGVPGSGGVAADAGNGSIAGDAGAGGGGNAGAGGVAGDGGASGGEGGGELFSCRLEPSDDCRQEDALNLAQHSDWSSAAIYPGDSVTVDVEVTRVGDGGQPTIDVGLLSHESADLVTIEPSSSPSTFGAYATIPFGVLVGEPETVSFDVTFGGDLSSGARVRFVTWISILGGGQSGYECVGPSREIDVTLE